MKGCGWSMSNSVGTLGFCAIIEVRKNCTVPVFTMVEASSLWVTCSGIQKQPVPKCCEMQLYLIISVQHSKICYSHTKCC